MSKQGAVRTVIGDGEGTTGQLVGRDLVVAGAGSQIGDLVGQARDVEGHRRPRMTGTSRPRGVSTAMPMFSEAP